MNNKITNQDLNKVSWRYIFASQWNWNYERMMGSGYLFAILPVLEKLYNDKPEELKEMLNTHNQFFNTNAFFGNLILGIDIAIEEEEGFKSKETIASMKTALMGSLAGVGDSLIHVVWGTIFGSIAGSLAISGSAVGLIVWFIANCFLVLLRCKMLPLGYKQGVKLITTLKDRLTSLTNAATVLGITVVGALVPNVVRANVALTYSVEGGRTLVIQDVLNQIMPNLVPVALVWLVYWLLGKKWMNSSRAIWFLLVLSVGLFNLGILG